jgi:hypothetical protein
VPSQSSTPRPPADRARVLLEINNAIVSHLDLAQVLKGVSDCLRREIKHDFAGLAYPLALFAKGWTKLERHNVAVSFGSKSEKHRPTVDPS